MRLARATGLLPSADMFARVTTEDAALDSFQNVLFSIARFREFTGAYPTRITIVGHDFKHRRFEQLHRLALRWPKIRFMYEGVPLRSEADEREATAGEVVLSVISSQTPSVSNPLFSFSWPMRLLRTPRTCTVATRPSSKSARSEIFTRELMATTSVHQKCASYWSGAQRMAKRSSLVYCHGDKSTERSEVPNNCTFKPF